MVHRPPDSGIRMNAFQRLTLKFFLETTPILFSTYEKISTSTSSKVQFRINKTIRCPLTEILCCENEKKRFFSLSDKMALTTDSSEHYNASQLH